MNATHLHLLLNHFPLIGTLIGSGLLLWGIIKKQNNIKTTASALLVIMAILAVPVFLTGEPAEESVEKLSSVSESMIELHESAAKLAIWLMGITGLVSLAAIIFSIQKRPGSQLLFTIAFGLSVICFAAMARTGYYGGQIRHSEIRDTNTGSVNMQENTNAEEAKKNSEKDAD